MSRQIINETFSLQVPDGFEVLTEEALRGMNRNAGDPFRWGARDAENHVVLLALWKQYPAILARLLDLKAIARKNEQLTRRAHEGFGYRLLESFSMQAGTEQAEGYRFSYEREGIRQTCSNILIRDGKTVYSFMCVGREENTDADRTLINRMMETLERA